VASPEDGDRRGEGPDGEDREGLSNLADAYQKAAPYLSASTTLVAAVGVFAWAGWWVDQKVGNRTPWFLLLGALLGMTGGFIGFFRTVLGKRRK
jgi:F0F1-type ATP synthase assembly protein I